MCVAFLLDHSGAYTVSFVAALVEYFFVDTITPATHHRGPGYYTGLLTVLLGQIIRTKAMLDAGSAFTHKVATKPTSGHHLVTSGIYQYMRHPSYAGFFVWSLGTQILLGNPLCLVGYAYVLHRFFSDRISYEEYYLNDFFPSEYPAYKERCFSGIPLIR